MGPRERRSGTPASTNQTANDGEVISGVSGRRHTEGGATGSEASGGVGWVISRWEGTRGALLPTMVVRDHLDWVTTFRIGLSVIEEPASHSISYNGARYGLSGVG